MPKPRPTNAAPAHDRPPAGTRPDGDRNGMAGIVGGAAGTGRGRGSKRPSVAHGPPVPGASSPASGCFFLADLTHPWAGAVAGPVIRWSPRPGRGRYCGAGGRSAPARRAAFPRRALPDRVIVLGRPTLFRQVQRLLADPRVTVRCRSRTRREVRRSVGQARSVAAGWPDLRELPEPEWSARWRRAERRGTGRPRGARRAGHRASPRLAGIWSRAARAGDTGAGLLAVAARRRR